NHPGRDLSTLALLTLPWRGRVVAHAAKRNAQRGGVISQHRDCWMGRDRHPTPPRIFIRGDPPPPGEGKKKRSIPLASGATLERDNRPPGSDPRRDGLG